MLVVSKRRLMGFTMRVLILWADNMSANLGVRVLAEGMAVLARRAWGNDIQIDFQNFGPGESEMGFGGRTILRDIGRSKGPIKAKIHQYDAILDSGAGDSFTDIYGLRRLAAMVYAHRVAFRSSVPVYMGPQTIGPFNSVIGKRAARYSLRRMNGVQARDKVSAYYASSLGRPVDVVSTDVVFALPKPESQARARDVVLNVSGLLWVPNAHVDSALYRSAVHDLIRGLLRDQREITLLAHVVDNPSLDNDTHVVEELGLQYAGRMEVVVPETLRQAREVISSARIVVGSRMHACLNALSVGVPAIPWAYSRKFEPLLADLGWDLGFDLRAAGNIAANTLTEIATLDKEKLASLLASLDIAAETKLRESVDALAGMRAR